MKCESTLVEYLKVKFDLDDCSEPMLKELWRLMHSYMIAISQRWKKCARNNTVFLNKNSVWINATIAIPNIDLASGSTRSTEVEVQKTPNRGRPTKRFEDSSCKSKKKIESINRAKIIS